MLSICVFHCGAFPLTTKVTSFHAPIFVKVILCPRLLEEKLKFVELIKFPLVCGGYRKMFGYERELDAMIIA